MIKKEVLVGIIGGAAGVIGLKKAYDKGRKDGFKDCAKIYDCMFDAFRELEKSKEEEKEDQPE